MIRYVVSKSGLLHLPDKRQEFIRNVMPNDKHQKLAMLLLGVAEPMAVLLQKYADKAIEHDYECKIVGSPEQLMELASWADSIYLDGAWDIGKHSWFKDADFNTIFDGKTVATTNEATSALSTQYWSADAGRCLNGYGKINAKVLSYVQTIYSPEIEHDNLEKENIYNELQNYGDIDTPIILLNLGDTAVIEQ